MNKRLPSNKGYLVFILILALLGSGCTGRGLTPQVAATPTSFSAPAAQVNTAIPAPTDAPTISPTESSPDAATVPVVAATPRPGVVYDDDFTKSDSGWQNQVKYDNYYFGYHEPEWYHVVIHSPNDYALVPAPFTPENDFSTEVQVFVNLDDTEPDGVYHYGLFFRRTGKQFYAFTVSPKTKEWFVLKSSLSGIETLQQGNNESIQGLKQADVLRVDANGQDMYFKINGQLVAQVSDPDYASGELGLFVQTLDSQKVHIHYDRITVLKYAPPDESGVRYQDDFTKPDTGWPQLKIDNYYFGYHEPEWYHVVVRAPNDNVLVPAPYKPEDDFTVEVQVFVNLDDTEPNGDYNYGVFFRRSGKQFYAFTISPTTKQWYVLKGTPTELITLQTGSNDTIHGLQAADKLRVDGKGGDFYFHINDQFVSLVSDPEYASGEMGFFVQTLDNPKAHIHYDSIVIRGAETPPLECTVNVEAVNLRAGPSKKYKVLATLIQGDLVKPLGRTSDEQWVQVRTGEDTQPGWISNNKPRISCNLPIGDLPVTTP